MLAPTPLYLCNALLDKSKSGSRSASLLEEALARSAETSLKVYTKDPDDAAEGSNVQVHVDRIRFQRNADCYLSYLDDLSV